MVLLLLLLLVGPDAAAAAAGGCRSCRPRSVLGLPSTWVRSTAVITTAAGGMLMCWSRYFPMLRRTYRLHAEQDKGCGEAAGIHIVSHTKETELVEAGADGVQYACSSLKTQVPVVDSAAAAAAALYTTASHLYGWMPFASTNVSARRSPVRCSHLSRSGLITSWPSGRSTCSHTDKGGMQQQHSCAVRPGPWPQTQHMHSTSCLATVTTPPALTMRADVSLSPCAHSSGHTAAAAAPWVRAWEPWPLSQHMLFHQRARVRVGAVCCVGAAASRLSEAWSLLGSACCCCCRVVHSWICSVLAASQRAGCCGTTTVLGRVRRVR